MMGRTRKEASKQVIICDQNLRWELTRGVDDSDFAKVKKIGKIPTK